MSLLEREHSLYVDGRWRWANGEVWLDVANPSDGTNLGRLAAARPEDVSDAATAAKRAFGSWKATSSEERAVFLRAFAAGLEVRQAELVEVQMLNNGKPRIEAEIDVGDAIATFAYYAELAKELDVAQDLRVDHPGGTHFGLVRHEPIGPVGMIVPWNFPLVTSAWKIAPALAAGCTVVLKTSEITPLAELVYGDIADEAELPAGVLNIVTGAAGTGKALTARPEFRKFSFTGSNMVGAEVMQAAASRCLPIGLELGGKSPIIVLVDADIDQAVDCIVGGIFFNAGQMCSATSRLIVDRTIEPRLIDALVEKTRALKIGNPITDDPNMGPITAKAQYRKVLDILDQAHADGLDCLVGGGAIERRGQFVAPTIYRNVPHGHAVWHGEIFGPVLATTTFSSDAEAIEMANDTQYGLAGSVVSGDWNRGKAVAEGIEAGQIWVNTPQIVYPDSAWGGFKQSGIGRELGPWGLSAYQGVKHILSETRDR